MKEVSSGGRRNILFQVRVFFEEHLKAFLKLAKFQTV
jgi:hypothetical protein